jgi:hypothetical protein
MYPQCFKIKGNNSGEKKKGEKIKFRLGVVIHSLVTHTHVHVSFLLLETFV